MMGVEALVRWPHPEYGLIPPGEFIPLAERTTLIGPLTRWVLEHALAQCRDWERLGLPLTVAVNLSTRPLYAQEFLSVVPDVLPASGRARSGPALESTGSPPMDHPDRA